MNKSPITTHILDTSQGRPAAGVTVRLKIWHGTGWKHLAEGVTNDDGRVTDLLPGDYALEAGIYRLSFEVGDYFSAHSREGFYPYVPVIFEIQQPDQHYHVPLLLNPYGYATYRGS